MSRCFPYPPPGYCRNGAEYEALIESIKLQKETGKAKADRKKEKRAKKEKKDKKHKEKRKDEEKSKLQKNPTEDSRKKLVKAADFNETHNSKDTAMPSGELLEKSDLTEEHGRPNNASHRPSYSSDSTQNSNKRKRDDAVLPDVSTVHGKPIKIRLLKKHKVSDSSKETLCPNSGRTDPSSLSGADARIKTVPSVPSSPYPDTTLVSVRNNGAPATSGRENNAAQGVRLSQTRTGSSSLIPGRKINDPQVLHLGKKQSALTSSRPILQKTDAPGLSTSKNSSVGVLQPCRPQPVTNYGRPAPPQSRLEEEAPSTSMKVHPVPSSIKPEVQVAQSSRQQQASGLLKHGLSEPVFAIGKRAASEIPLPSEPPKKTESPQKVKLTRLEKKIRKKHAKYEKLIGSWAPPAFQAMLPDINDEEEEDWLSRRTQTTRSSFSRDEVETCRDAASMSWQPCARFLAEGGIHALPYTVPF